MYYKELLLQNTKGNKFSFSFRFLLRIVFFNKNLHLSWVFDIDIHLKSIYKNFSLSFLVSL